MTYDVRLRPVRALATREAPAGVSTPDLNAVNTVHDFRYTWDVVSNLREVSDLREVSEWPAGYRPWRQRVEHDALYRVNEIDIHYMTDAGAFSPTQTDAATDWRDERTRVNADMSTHEQRDPMRRRPAPMVSENAPERVRNLVYDYDWLGNMSEWTDDAGVFYERSTGPIMNGSDDPSFNGWEPTHRPSALYLSTNIREAGGSHSATEDRGGYVWLDYGDSGNVVGMTVHAQCRDVDASHLCTSLDPATSSFDDRKDALEDGCVCAQEQHYRYDWDELNRLAEARRYDRTGGTGTWALAVQQRYRYDAGNVRMVKETIDHGASPFAAVSLSPYPGDYERRGLVLDAANGIYDTSTSLGSETQYTIGGARLVWRNDDTLDGALRRDQRLTLSLSDLVQSTAAVVDLQSGELLEHTTFYPNGARETHRTTDDVSMQLEPVGFTGKEADEEVGLVYFGERYLIPRLGRWASVDPLSVHAVGGGEALNGYHYVSGNLLQARDPLGLDVVETTKASHVPAEISSGGKGAWWVASLDGAFRPTEAQRTQIAGACGRVYSQECHDALGAVSEQAGVSLVVWVQGGLEQWLGAQRHSLAQRTVQAAASVNGVEGLHDPNGNPDQLSPGSCTHGACIRDVVFDRLVAGAHVLYAVADALDTLTSVLGVLSHAAAGVVRRAADEIIERVAREGGSGGGTRHSVVEIATETGPTRGGGSTTRGEPLRRRDYVDGLEEQRVDFDGQPHSGVGTPHVHDVHRSPSDPTLGSVGHPRDPGVGEYLSPVLSDPRTAGGEFRP